MDGDIDLEGKVISMKRTQFSIKDMLAQEPEAKPPPEAAPPPPLPEAGNSPAAAEALPSLDDLMPLPGPGDPYKAYARPSNQMLPALVLLLADGSKKGFSYGNLDTFDLLDSSGPGQGPAIFLRFNDREAEDVRLAGRHLDMLYAYICRHRVWWVRERAASKEFRPERETETVITGITITKVKV